MPRAATKEAAEPALDLDMKDVTPKKGDDKPAEQKPAKASAAKPKNAVAVRESGAAARTKSESKTLMEIVKDAALDSRVDAGKMKALLDMAREEQNRVNDTIFEAAKFDVQKKIPPIAKDSWNEHTKSKWAKLEKISYIADPIIREHGFSLSYGGADCPVENHYRVVCDVTHVPTGYTKRYWIDIGMDSAGAKGGGTKSLAQGSGSSATYARRFLKVMIFDINVIGEDFDGTKFAIRAPSRPSPAAEQDTPAIEHQKPKGLTLEQSTKLVALIKSSGVGLEKFLDKYQIKAVIDLTPALYDRAVDACNNYAREVKSKTAKS